MTKRERVIARLKTQAREHYYQSIIPDDIDCSAGFASEVLGMDYGNHRDELERCIARLRRIDPSFPRS